MRTTLRIAVCLLCVSLTAITYFGVLKYRASIEDHSYHFLSAFPCSHPLDGSRYTVPRLMEESESFVLTIIFRNSTEYGCEATIAVIAPAFDVQPADVQRFTLDPNGPTTHIWIVTPKKIGNHQIAIRGGFDYDVRGIAVTNALGLTAWQAQLLAWAGAFLSGTLTLPWWIEKWMSWRAKRRSTGSGIIIVP